MKFSPDFIERVREANNIVDLVGQHVQLQKAGSSFRGLCPFPNHAEKTPSFFVSETKQLYHCFGCKKSGSVFNFLIDFQGMTFREAVESLAARGRIELPKYDKTTVQEEEAYDERKVLLKLNRFVAASFFKKLQSAGDSHIAKKYLVQRGLNPETVNEFKLGYASNGWSDLSQFLKASRAPLNLAEKLGLIKRKNNGEYFDIFRERLMFPILSVNGNVIGFGGRTLDNQTPKYINSSESPVFSKGKTLYGLHATAKYIRASNEAFIVEGYMDLIALYQAGVRNVVATLGTAFTLDHAKILKRLCARVVVLFDGDEAGQLAADKSLPILLESGLFARCLALPEGLDPDEYILKYGLSAFQSLAERSPDHFLHFLGRKMAEFKGQPSEKIEILDTVSPILGRVTDQRLRILYLQETAERLSIDPKLIRSAGAALRRQDIEITDKNKNDRVLLKRPREEEILVHFMLQDSRHLELINKSSVIEKFVDTEAKTIALRIIERYCQNPSDFDRLGVLLSGEGINSELITSQIAFNSGLDEAGEQQMISDCLARVNERYRKKESKNILNEIKRESHNEGLESKLETFMKIAKEQKGLKSPS